MQYEICIFMFNCVLHVKVLSFVYDELAGV